MDHNLHIDARQNFAPLEKKQRGSAPHLALLTISKLLLSLAVFYCYDILKFVNFLQFFFYAKLLSAIVLVLFQRPFTNGKKLTRSDVKYLVIYSAISFCLTLLWMEGLAICGPVRTILTSLQSEIVFLVILNAVFCAGGSETVPSASRGIGYYGVGLLCLLFLDKDTKHVHNESDVPMVHLYHHSVDIFTWLGLPDHKGGLLLLVIISTLQVVLNKFARSLQLHINGAKRFHALATCGELMFASPFFLISHFVKSETISLWSFPYEAVFVIAVMFVLDYYVDAMSASRMNKYGSARTSTYVLFVSAVAIGLLWEHWYDVHFKHKISSGVMFAAISFMIATRILGQPPPLQPPKRTLIGYSTSGLPLYTYETRSKGAPAAKTLLIKMRQYLKTVIESPESRSIFFYLCLNLVFTGVELLYGVWTNSLGLISDGFHMLFDCSALVLGLWAAIASKWSATKTFSFGYGRIEVLSGFVNGLFLIVIAVAVFLTAIQRIYDPPHVHTENLLTISVLGLLVNLVGITAFSHVHSHGGKQCDHGHSHDSSNSHGHSHQHGHSSHGNHEHGHSHKKKQAERKMGSANMEGVFLHVLADTLGSVGVIISTLLIKYYGLNIADPICSLFIAIMIVASVIPLLKNSSLVLLQRTPKEMEPLIDEALIEIKRITNVLTCRQLNIWQHTSDNVCGCLVLQVRNEASEHIIRQQVCSILKGKGVSQITVQVEKQSFHDHMSKLTTGYYTEQRFPQYQTIANERSFVLEVNNV